MRDCELCDSPATMYCESDQAILCWSCDAQVHSANFLVARHSRNLLCHTCQSPTPWKASGSSLGPTISVCDRCTTPSNPPKITSQQQQQQQQQDEIDDADDVDDDEEDEEEEEEEEKEEDDGDNQVVPWSSSPPPIPTSFSSDESSSRLGSALKQTRENEDLSSQDDHGCSSSNQGESSSIEVESMCLGSFLPLIDRKTMVMVQSEWRLGVIDSVRRFAREEEKVCKDQSDSR